MSQYLNLAQEVEQNRKGQETVGEFALRALRHAIWLGEDTEKFKVYADKEVDRLLEAILDKPLEFQGFTQAQLTAGSWRDNAEVVQLWLSVSGKDETKRLEEIKRRLENNKGLFRVRGVPPVNF